MIGISLTYYMISAAPADVRNYRVILVIDKQANGAAPIWSDLFIIKAAPNNSHLAPISARAIAVYSKCFRILKDHQFTIDQASRGAYQAKMAIKFKKPIVVRYDSSDTGNIDDIVGNSLWLFFVSSDTEVNWPTITFYSRVRFMDS